MEKQTKPTPALSQKEYLQRYLSKDSKKPKKKKSKQPAVSSSKHLKRSVIIDDDINLKDLPSSISNEDDINLDFLGDEAPQIAGFVDERPDKLKFLESSKIGLWRESETTAAEDAGDGEPIGSGKKRANVRSAPDEDGDSDQDLRRPKGEKRTTHPTKSRRQDRAEERSDSDIEPPRRKDRHSKAGGSKRSKKNERDGSRSESDMELPRKRNKNDSSRIEDDRRSSHRKRRNSEEDSDLDVPRPERKSKKTDVKRNSRKNTNGSESDLDIPRKAERRRDSDEPRRKKTDDYKHSRSRQKSPDRATYKTNSADDSDLEVPRERSRKNKTNDKGEKGSERRRDSDVEAKSKGKMRDPRENAAKKGRERNISLEDDSRRRRRSSDSQPQKKRQHRGSDGSDMEVPRRKRENSGATQQPSRRSSDDSDQSPPRKGNRSRSAERTGRQFGSKNSDPTQSKPQKDGKRKSGRGDENRLEKMQDGKKAGLQDAKSLKDELRLLKDREDQMYREMDPELLGKSAEAVVRDRKTGARRDFEKERRIEMEKAAKSAVRQKKYDRWGKGLKQVQEQEERLVDMVREMSKPLARYADDDDLERSLKAQEREGDPMLDYIKNHQKESHSIDLTGSGGVRKRYAGSFPPNRFNIGPGHRWDGVDRSNGYEQKWFAARNAKKAGAEEAWKWSSADM